MTITVTLLCRHEDGFSDHRTIAGSHSVVVTSRIVMLDGTVVVERDRRARKNREPGHPWVSPPGPDHPRQAWTGFSVNVEPSSRS